MNRRTVAALVCAVSALGGCALGPRPTLTDERRVDDSAIEAVLDRLDAADDSVFTAVYTISSTAAGSVPHTATVTHSPAETYTVFGVDGAVIVEYVTADGEQRTCAAERTDCVTGPLDEARISNLGISSLFWGPSTAQRLRTDGNRSIGDAIAGATTVAGQSAACVDVPVGGTVPTVAYCALDAGPLASYVGADANIELTSYTPG